MSGTSMVEIVARAIFDKLMGDHGPYSFAEGENPDSVTLDGQFDMRDLARAAIAAMREPTMEMIYPRVAEIIKMADFIGPAGAMSYVSAALQARTEWQAAMDAALAPSIDYAAVMGLATIKEGPPRD
jgi:hypothetical protein